jgi:hypothetical protein
MIRDMADGPVVGRLSATYGRWPALSYGHSNVGSTQPTDLRAPILSVASSAIAAVGPSTIERPV